MAAGKLSATTRRNDFVAVADCTGAQQIEKLCEHHVECETTWPWMREPDSLLTLGKHRLDFQMIHKQVCAAKH